MCRVYVSNEWFIWIIMWEARGFHYLLSFTVLSVRNSQCRCKFGQLGPGKGQFNSPHGFCLGMDEDIVVADTNNHRVQVFEKTGEFKYQFGIPGMLLTLVV